ncbi:MAG TPA: hypothetical protein GXZ74_01600 [Tissierellia bacterium]|nr:hypothetical protein [Tissierellia bacterium]
MAIIYLALLLFFFGYGYYLRYHPPKEIGTGWGYKSAKAKKTQRNWDLAQKTLGTYMYRLAILTVGVIILSRFGPKLSDTVVYLLALIPIVLFFIALVILPRRLPD